MQKILIVSTSFSEQEQLEAIAQHHNPGGWTIQTTASFAQESSWWATNGPDLLIVELPADDLLQGYYFTKIRKDLPKSQKIIFLSPAISASLIQLSTEYSRVRLIKTPIDGYSFYKAVEDILKDWEPGKRQVHPRYLTDVNVEIRSDFKDGVNQGIMKNLSKSGAYFEVIKPEFPLEAGEFIHLAIPQSNGKQYLFDAKVVWAKKLESGGSQSASAFGYGVAFIDKEDVYMNLLKGF